MGLSSRASSAAPRTPAVPGHGPTLTDSTSY